jgi:hypothetical protein
MLHGNGEVAGMANGSGEAADCRVDTSAGDERGACGAGRRRELAPGVPVASGVPARYVGRSCHVTSTLLPVVLATSGERIRERCREPNPAGATGAIHIEFPGRAAITVESGANIDLLRTVLESLRP